ncbi:hypothetical protein [Anaerotignum sp.]|uniref:hypothetical protein n=1 Tax=Anaerotignum sp. TaxID=2039241 RepID=UPI0028AEBF2B|nr:hypothetical protein [Anaerotignum sp.]
MRKRKIFIIVVVDIIILSFLLLASSTDLILKERLEKSDKITVLVDAVGSESDENFKMGLTKGAMDWNMDVNLSYITNYEDVEDIKALLQKEIDNGSAGLILNCKNKEMAEGILSVVPVGMPVILWNMDMEAPRVRGTVSGDRDKEISLLVQEIMDVRTEGQDVALIERHGSYPEVNFIHEELNNKLTEKGVQVRLVKIEELSSADTLVKGMAVQKKNILVSADFMVLKALAESCQESKIVLPLYGFGWGLSIRNCLEEGYVSGLVVQRSYEAGYFVLSKVARMVKKEDDGEELLIIESTLVTPSNMYKSDIETFIFPYT